MYYLLIRILSTVKLISWSIWQCIKRPSRVITIICALYMENNIPFLVKRLSVNNKNQPLFGLKIEKQHESLLNRGLQIKAFYKVNNT